MLGSLVPCVNAVDYVPFSPPPVEDWVNPGHVSDTVSDAASGVVSDVSVLASDDGIYDISAVVGHYIQPVGRITLTGGATDSHSVESFRLYDAGLSQLFTQSIYSVRFSDAYEDMRYQFGAVGGGSGPFALRSDFYFSGVGSGGIDLVSLDGISSLELGLQFNFSASMSVYAGSRIADVSPNAIFGGFILRSSNGSVNDDVRVRGTFSPGTAYQLGANGSVTFPQGSSLILDLDNLGVDYSTYSVVGFCIYSHFDNDGVLTGTSIQTGQVLMRTDFYTSNFSPVVLRTIQSGGGIFGWLQAIFDALMSVVEFMTNIPAFIVTLVVPTPDMLTDYLDGLGDRMLGSGNIFGELVGLLTTLSHDILDPLLSDVQPEPLTFDGYSFDFGDGSGPLEVLPGFSYSELDFSPVFDIIRPVILLIVLVVAGMSILHTCYQLFVLVYNLIVNGDADPTSSLFGWLIAPLNNFFRGFMDASYRKL